MKRFAFIFIALCLLSPIHAQETLVLSNDVWPPFIIDGAEQGTAEKIVCQALDRAGWECLVEVRDWETVLAQVKEGEIDGIAAAWRNPERETYLLFSQPYLTNRIVPVMNTNKPVHIQAAGDLVGLRIAMVTDFAYGDEIEAMIPEFELVGAKNPTEALRSVQEGYADAALVDELVARGLLEEGGFFGVMVTDAALAFRDLHFAVSRKHPRAEEIIADFHRTFEIMLDDGTVNEILNIDWLATDFGHTGQIDVVMRSGTSLDNLSNPTKEGSVYALERSEYQLMRQPTGVQQPARVNYQVEGKSHSSLQDALTEVFGKDVVCEHKEYSSEFDCSKLLKNLRSNQ